MKHSILDAHMMVQPTAIDTTVLPKEPHNLIALSSFLSNVRTSFHHPCALKTLPFPMHNGKSLVLEVLHPLLEILDLGTLSVEIVLQLLTE